MAIGTSRSDDVTAARTSIGLISKTTTLHVHHTFLYIFFVVLFAQLRREDA